MSYALKINIYKNIHTLANHIRKALFTLVAVIRLGVLMDEPRHERMLCLAGVLSMSFRSDCH
jgi:hypothetical protein